MRNILLAVLLLVFPLASIAQNKKDNAILIPADGITQDQLIATLVTSGYGISNQSQSYILTESVEKRGVSIKLSILKKDSTYLLTGWFNTNSTLMGVKDDFSVIEYRGMKNSLFMRAWDEMATVAKKLSGNLQFVKN